MERANGAASRADPHVIESSRTLSRIWDRFLTDRDKEHLRLIGPLPRIGFGAKPAIVLIDNYRGVFGDRPLPLLEAAKQGRGLIGEEAWTAVEWIAELLAAGRAAQIPVVHITGLVGAGLPGWSASIRAGYQRGDLAVGDPVNTRHCEIMPQVQPIEGEIVLAKSAPSAFWGTPLPAALNYLGVDTLIIGGESTSGCVRATVVDAAAYRYRVIIAEECTYDRHQASHAINLFDMNQKYADVLPLSEVIDWIDGHGSVGKAV